MKKSIFAMTLGLGLAASGAAMADDCGAPRTIDYCDGASACGVMYVPYYDANNLTPNITDVTVSGPRNVSVELPPVGNNRPESVCLAYFLPVGTYNVTATFADGTSSWSKGVQVDKMRTAVTCPQVSIDLAYRRLSNDPILCRGLVHSAS